MKIQIRLLLAALLLCCIARSLTAQAQKCAPLVPLPTSTEANFFADEKEVFLGDAIAEHIQKNYRVIDDESATKYLSPDRREADGEPAPDEIGDSSFSWLTCPMPMLLCCLGAESMSHANWWRQLKPKMNWQASSRMS